MLGENVAVLVKVARTPVIKKTRSMQVTILPVPGKELLELVWFRMPYVKSTLTIQKWFVFYGKLNYKNNHYVMEQPAIYPYEKYKEIEERLLPVYALTNGLTNNTITKTVTEILNQDITLPDFLPSEVRSHYQLCERNYAIKQIHFPDYFDNLIEVRKRLVFDEFFLFILGMQYQKERKIKEENGFCFQEDGFVNTLIQKLPFSLTGAQLRAIEDIEKDMKGPYVMQRLLQGDVGSGKTIIAFLLMAMCAHNQYQSAIMAPTEVLAKQHYESFCKMVEEYQLPFSVILLTGSMTAKEKKECYARLKEEKNALIVGTHALIQEKAIYSNLALVITDEQHRFGVKQRDTFSEKGQKPHVLVMSATPIPRTLAIILYGDLDISVIDEVPAKRLPIKNCVVNTTYRPKAYDFITKQIQMGHQAYVICPLVESSENADGENVSDYVNILKDALPQEISVAHLHGKMKPAQKNTIMEQFARNEIQVLVSTTVIEVGINVPNATVMMIENAEKFGLAQLHQLRGRVGRGDAQSYCILVNASNTKTAQRRLEILNHSNDGFFIASEDLKMRGPGDFFGIRQSGDLAFELGDIYQDAPILQAASEAVSELLAEDPELSQPQHKMLQEEMAKFEAERLAKMSL